MSTKHQIERCIAGAIMFGRIVRMNDATYEGCPTLFLFIVYSTDHTDKCLIKSLDHTISHWIVGSSAGLLHPANLQSSLMTRLVIFLPFATAKSKRKALEKYKIFRKYFSSGFSSLVSCRKRLSLPSEVV